MSTGDSTYQVTLTGITSVLMHNDALDSDEDLDRPKARKQDGRAGDDRCPADKWKGYCYFDAPESESVLVIPTENISAALAWAAGRIKKGKASYKSDAMYLRWDKPSLVLYPAGGKPITQEQIEAIDGTFAQQRAAVTKLKFELWPKRCVIQNKRHVRVRPRFAPGWRVQGVFRFSESDGLNETLVRRFFHDAGMDAGICDWRPSCKKPGAYGRFTVELKKLK